MKNIHILPTDKPSRLYKNINNQMSFTDIKFEQSNNFNTNQHLYIISNEEIKEGDWTLDQDLFLSKIDKEQLEDNSKETIQGMYKKIILTTNSDLIKDDVQAIDDEFLEWFVSKANDSGKPIDIVEVVSEKYILQHLFKPQEYKFRWKIIIPKEEPKYTTSNLDNDKYKDFSVLKEDLRKYPLTHDECFKEEPTQDFYKIGDFDGHCDDACKYHCNKGNTQLAECLNKPKQESNIVFVTTEQAVRIFGAKKLNKLLKEHKQKTLKEVAERIFKIYSNNTSLAEGHYDYMMDKEDFKEASLEIANWQQERSYSEEEVWVLLNKLNETLNIGSDLTLEQWFEQSKNKV